MAEPDQTPIEAHVLRDHDTEITVLSVGCAIQDWRVGGRPVVLGYADRETYRSNPVSMGVVVGRVANRISGAAFDLDGAHWTLPGNSAGGAIHIHGGPGGFGWRHWRMVPDGPKGVSFHLHSPHLDQGYPGALDVEVNMTLNGSALTWEMHAHSDRPTPVNLAQHVYFNLAGEGDIRKHRLRIAADAVTPTDADLLPTGQIQPVAGSRFDFREMRFLEEADPDRIGYDLNYVLSGGAPQAEALSPDGMRLSLTTDAPGLQVYTSNTLRDCGPASDGAPHAPFGGLCLEAQGFPNAINTPGFPSVECAPEQPFHQRTTIDIQPDP